MLDHGVDASEENTQKHKISEIANLPLDELTALMGERDNAPTTHENKKIKHLIELVDQYRWDDLERAESDKGGG